MTTNCSCSLTRSYDIHRRYKTATISMPGNHFLFFRACPELQGLQGSGTGASSANNGNH